MKGKKGVLRESKNMTTGTGRKIVGGVFTALALILTGQVSFVMTRRIHKVAQPKVYRKNLFAEQMLSLMMILTSLDIMLGIFSKFKNRFMKVVGWIFRIIAYFSSAVVLFFSGKIIIGSLIRHRKKSRICNRTRNGVGRRSSFKRFDLSCGLCP